MMKISTLSKMFLFAAAFAMLGLGACKKEATGKLTNINVETEKSKKLKSNVAKALRDFAVASPAGSNLSTNSGGGGSVYSNTAVSYTTYSTPSANVYVWSDPSTGTVFTLTESTTGGGLGQLSYNNKSFDYNYVLSIKASNNDPSWSGFMNGRDLRGAVAIDGELQGTDFSLKNLAIFLVATTGGSGTYEFIDWSSSTVASGDAIGELLDFSSVAVPTLASMNDAKFYLTSNGHVIVDDGSIEMASDAKVKDIVTNVEYSIDGSLMFE